MSTAVKGSPISWNLDSKSTSPDVKVQLRQHQNVPGAATLPTPLFLGFSLPAALHSVTVCSQARPAAVFVCIRCVVSEPMLGWAAP